MSASKWLSFINSSEVSMTKAVAAELTWLVDRRSVARCLFVMSFAKFHTSDTTDLLATCYEEVSDKPDHRDMLRWSESRHLLRNFLVTSWRHARLPRTKSLTCYRLHRNICYEEITMKWSQWNLAFYTHLASYVLVKIVKQAYAWTQRQWLFLLRT